MRGQDRFSLLLYLAGLLALVFGGPDALSLERWLEQRRGFIGIILADAAL